MTVYFMVSYDIEDTEAYKKYNPGSNHITAQTVAKHGGEIMVATNNAEQLAGAERDMRVVIQFPDRSAAQAWHNDPDYASAKAIRLATTKNIDAVILDALILPN